MEVTACNPIKTATLRFQLDGPPSAMPVTNEPRSSHRDVHGRWRTIANSRHDRIPRRYQLLHENSMARPRSGCAATRRPMFDGVMEAHRLISERPATDR